MTEAHEGNRQKVAIISTTSTGVITGLSHVAEELLGLRSADAIGELIPVCVQGRTDLKRRGMALASVAEPASTAGFRGIVAAVEVSRPSE